MIANRWPEHDVNIVALCNVEDMATEVRDQVAVRPGDELSRHRALVRRWGDLVPSVSPGVGRAGAGLAVGALGAAARWTAWCRSARRTSPSGLTSFSITVLR